MSKKKKLKTMQREVLSTKELFIKYAKRYGIVLAIAAPIIMFINYFISTKVEGYEGPVAFFVAFAMLLLACFIGLIIFTKKDDKQKKYQTKENERDPFAD
ncbi:MAG: hypothetical protein IJD48_02610 [Clostridia bacterium]|nr:hypothetical protein [Clostridia bacterium]